MQRSTVGVTFTRTEISPALVQELNSGVFAAVNRREWFARARMWQNKDDKRRGAKCTNTDMFLGTIMSAWRCETLRCYIANRMRHSCMRNHDLTCLRRHAP
jgi:hypothetical protein